MRDIHQDRCYRLLAPPPFTVTFPSVMYRVEIRQVHGAPVWELWASAVQGGPNWRLWHGGPSRPKLERDLYGAGITVLWPTVPGLIMERLCAEGRAERLTRIRTRLAVATGSPPRPTATPS